MADPGVGPAGPQAGTAVPVAMPVASGSAGPVAVSRAEMDTLRTETSGKAGAGPLGKAASAGTEATAAVAAVTSVTAVTSAPAAAVTEVTTVTSAMPGPKGLVARPSGVDGSGTTPEDNRPVCLKRGAKGHYHYHLVVMNESLGKAAAAGTEATAAVAAVTSVTAVTSAPAAAVTEVTTVTSAVLGPKGLVARPSGVVGSGTTPEDNRPVKILLNLRRQFTAYKGNALNYCVAVKRIKFKLIRTKAWTLGSWLIERLSSLQACRTSRSCGRFRQVDYSVFRKIASWIWEAITVKVSRCSSCPILRWIHRRCRNRCDSVDRRRGRWTHRQGWWTHRRCQDSVDHSSWLRNLTRSWMRSIVRFGSLKTIRLVIMNSFKTRTIWLRLLEQSVRAVVDEDVCVVVDNNVVGGEMVDNKRSGSPETTCWSTNSFKTRTFWFGFWIWLRLKSFKTRTFWFRSFRTFWLRLNRGEVVVADNVNAVIVVDDDQSGLPETIRLCENGHNVCGRVEVDDEQSGFPETIRWVMNSFRTRMNWRSVRVVVDEDVCVVVDNNVCGRVEVDDEQSGFSETIRLEMNKTKTRFGCVY